MEPHFSNGETNSSEVVMRWGTHRRIKGSALANLFCTGKWSKFIYSCFYAIKIFTYETLLFLMGPVFHLGDCTSIFSYLK